VSLYGQASDFRFVDPASHMQLWPDVEPEIRIIMEDEPDTPPPRVARKWQPERTAQQSKLPPSDNRKLPGPALEQTDPTLTKPGSAPAPLKSNDDKEPVDVRKQVELLEVPQSDSSPKQLQNNAAPIDCYQAPPLSVLTAGIDLPSGKLPTNVAARCSERISPTGDPRLMGGWGGTEHHWSATCMRHRPLYFEEINAERYGYTASYCLQPVISAARFFGTIPALPYKMVVQRPRDCIYTLGHYRPGNCAPRRWHRLPWKLTAGVVEIGFIAGMILIIP
jgi:hypothetical protein